MSDLSERIVAEALDWVGTPYRHQGSTRGVGCDCLGLVRGVWRAVLGEEPEPAGAYHTDWLASGEEILLDAARRHCREKPVAAMRPGDLLVFRWRTGMSASHCGIAVSAERFVHAYERHAVMLSWLAPSWRRRIAGVFAFPEPEQR
ncbi:MAG: C40 family peptidase [Rhizobiaceae bacterium]|nr:C40 family peptidase [Rhizobiaceae bacterium]MCV0405475.1 C40 family peptidase [Rhizobiaceae bacterium]